jgi:hypothetical protein
VGTPTPVLCLYTPKAGKEAEFIALIEKHGTALRAAGLITDTPVRAWRAHTRSGAPLLVELFEWRDADSSRQAHEHPEVQAVWEPMGAIADDMQFHHLEPLDLPS